MRVDVEAQVRDALTPSYIACGRSTLCRPERETIAVAVIFTFGKLGTSSPSRSRCGRAPTRPALSAVAVVARFRAAAGVTHLDDRPTIEAAVTDPTGMSGLEATVNSVVGFSLLGDHRCPADGAWQGYR